MGEKQGPHSRVAIIYGMLPSMEEVDQLQLIHKDCHVTVISSESIIGYFLQNSYYEAMQCIALPDHDEQTTFLPGLEKELSNFDLVIIKERLGVYAFQTVKAKWKYRFRLLVWVDNLSCLPGEDIPRMRTVREEVCKAADGFIVQTEAARQALSLEGIHPDKILTWGTWVARHCERSATNKRQALQALGLNDRDFLIVYQGPIEWEEGLLDLLNGFKLAKEQDTSLAHRLKLVLYGIGSFASEFKQRSITLGIDQHIHYIAPQREAYATLLQAADAFFLASYPSRDRLDGDPYRLITAMTHGIPILAPRNPLSEELVGKHRFDYCAGSGESLAKALIKLSQSKNLVHDVVQKNTVKLQSLCSAEKVAASMRSCLAAIAQQPLAAEGSGLDQQVIEVEAKVGAGQYLAAIDLIEAILARYQEMSNHHKANLYRLIGDCFTKLGDSEAGKQAYVQGIELDPYSAKAHIGLGTVSLTKANFDIAIIHFQKALSLAPNDEMANLGLGLAFHGLDELFEAQKWVRKALELNPANTAALYTLVKLSQELENYEVAEQALRRYLHQHPADQNMLYSLAGILFSMRKYDEVLETLHATIVTNPMDARAQSLIKQAKRALAKGEQSSLG